MWVFGRERSHLDASDIGAVLDVVHTARGYQCLQVDILVGLARRVGGAVNPRGAVHVAQIVDVGVADHRREPGHSADHVDHERDTGKQ